MSVYKVRKTYPKTILVSTPWRRHSHISCFPVMSFPSSIFIVDPLFLHPTPLYLFSRGPHEALVLLSVQRDRLVQLRDCEKVELANLLAVVERVEMGLSRLRHEAGGLEARLLPELAGRAVQDAVVVVLARAARRLPQVGVVVVRGALQ
ncbi:hypothetical protein LMH87_000079 [Akanthomyces muscarius]|uniref:Uncharacterized protein n=1 Tax=Akanthomyces muscarius TaxID=2231603 RepID=A0A9W8UKS8_AKAMU|nr:hypothetical protein LMH87_000079 [Akanthomyces muscarius]KAJ4154803.1 hypothetical protein LMH87_000079 [Akanthomyces muscarius]